MPMVVRPGRYPVSVGLDHGRQDRAIAGHYQRCQRRRTDSCADAVRVRVGVAVGDELNDDDRDGVAVVDGVDVADETRVPVAVPLVGRTRPRRSLMVVVFPAPFGPRKPKMVFRVTSRSLPRTA